METQLIEALKFISFGLRLADVEEKLSTTNHKEKNQKIINQLVKEIKKNEEVIANYKEFTDYLKKDQTYPNQLLKIQELVQVNLNDLKIYFGNLKRTLKRNTAVGDHFHDIQNNLPGSIHHWQWGVDHQILTLDLIYKIYSLAEGNKLHGQWKKQRGDEEVQAALTPFEDLKPIFGEEESKRIQSILEESKAIHTGDPLEDIPERALEIRGIGNINESLLIESGQKDIIFKGLFKLYSIRTETFNVFEKAGETILEIIGLVEELEKDPEQKKLKELQELIEKFEDEEEEILGKVERFLAGFELQVIAFRVLTDQLITLAKFNLHTFPNIKEVTEQINELNVEEVFNQKIICEIRESRKELRQNLHKEGNSHRRCRQQSEDKFKAVLKTLRQLDKEVGILDIERIFQQKLKIARTLYQEELSFKKPRAVSLFLQIAETLVFHQQPLEIFEKLYMSVVEPQIKDVPSKEIDDQGKLTIAKAISVFTTEYLGQKTLYGKYNLQKFRLPLTAGTENNKKQSVAEIDLTKLQPEWAKKQIKISKRNISQAFDVRVKNIKYLRSTVWAENRGNEGNPKFMKYRVQVFEEGPTTYYVLYYFNTNLFADVRANQIDNDQ